MPNTKERRIGEAKAILRGESAATPAELVERAKELESLRAHRWARELLQLTRRDLPPSDALGRRVLQRLARCTYKDADLPAAFRLDEAERILGLTEDLAVTRDQETLGLAGAIAKRRWEVLAQKQHLERALAFYQRGYEQGIAGDSGYTAVNAAFVLDVLATEEAAQARVAGLTAPAAADRQSFAGRIRREIIEVLGGRPEDVHDWWSLVTLAEAAFGLRDYDAASRWLRRARAVADTASVPDWQRETTARQLAALYRLQEGGAADAKAFANSEAGRALAILLGGSAPAVLGAYRGKVGLALSGGGFRAALFHLGVLARLAELDMLRNVEVISCVSGGSIIGAHYYLELKELLESKPDQLIDRQDYIDLVARVERDFLAGVQANVRMRVLAGLGSNLRMLRRHDYSRTHRVGELYEELIYSRVGDGNGLTPRWMDTLFVRPHGEPVDFHPTFDNGRRAAKVPMLVLNATTLNTGHSWQFTASWMGEPPAEDDAGMDCNDIYRRMYYAEAPPEFRRFRLGHAVAASSCVPGLFEPLPLVGLFADRVVRLVDGGVHDNQGVASLLEQNCDVVIVSDASGQMSTEDQPTDGLLGVPMRANSILMARVRDAQARDLLARRRSSLLRGLLFLHLKQDMRAQALPWIGCDEPGAEPPAVDPEAVTSYGVLRRIQSKLARMRTDLDSFSDLEAWALMESGYRMTREAFGSALKAFDAPEAPAVAWRFRAVAPLLDGSAPRPLMQRLERVLDTASHRALKIWRLSRPLQVFALAIVLAAALPLGRLLWENRPFVLFQLTIGSALATAGTLVAAALLGGAAARALRYRKSTTQYALTIGAVIAGWLVARIHLRIFDKLFLRYGRLTTPAHTEPPATRPRSEARAEEQLTGSAPGPDSHVAAEPEPERKVRKGMAPKEPEPVMLGASAPRAARPGDEFTARFVAYIKSLETEVRRTLEGLSPSSVSHLGVQSCRWEPGTRVTVRLTGSSLTADPAQETFTWSGERELLEFDVRVDPDARLEVTVLKFDVLVEGIRVARLRLDLDITAEGDATPVAAIGEPARTAFASYASEDSARVLDRVASVRTSADLDVFLDCLSLHPGEEWKPRLREEIERRDLFLLFWSPNARESRWVDWEWRTALEHKGIDEIQPHPLEPVDRAPPPEELQALHFGDAFMLLRRATEKPGD